MLVSLLCMVMSGMDSFHRLDLSSPSLRELIYCFRCRCCLIMVVLINLIANICFLKLYTTSPNVTYLGCPCHIVYSQNIPIIVIYFVSCLALLHLQSLLSMCKFIKSLLVLAQCLVVF